eukprot:scpid35694/ scgid13797/ 
MKLWIGNATFIRFGIRSSFTQHCFLSESFTSETACCSMFPWSAVDVPPATDIPMSFSLSILQVLALPGHQRILAVFLPSTAQRAPASNWSQLRIAHACLLQCTQHSAVMGLITMHTVAFIQHVWKTGQAGQASSAFDPKSNVNMVNIQANHSLSSGHLAWPCPSIQDQA